MFMIASSLGAVTDEQYQALLESVEALRAEITVSSFFYFLISNGDCLIENCRSRTFCQHLYFWLPFNLIIVRDLLFFVREGGWVLDILWFR